MPGVLVRARSAALDRQRTGRYLAYAAGEVVLIFIGITLAIAFNNRNERLRSVVLARELLAAVQEDLQANIEELDRNAAQDARIIASLDPVIRTLTDGTPWHDSLSIGLVNAGSWASPYLTRSAYESLTELGIQLIASQAVRTGIVSLYESTYAYLLGEQETVLWSFFENQTSPVWVRELERFGTSEGMRFRPKDYSATLATGELLFVTSQHYAVLQRGVRTRQEARDATERMIVLIGDFLDSAQTNALGGAP